MNIEAFQQLESNVRYYCRACPEVFSRAKDSLVFGESGKEYIDFFTGAGALNYGHNNEFIKARILDYLQADHIAHALDFYTSAKRQFLETFQKFVLEPRKLSYKLQFCGPTGTNAVEAALKLARKQKRRQTVFSFMGAYHGMSLGSLAVTSFRKLRAGAGTSLGDVVFMPYPYGFMATFDSIQYIRAVLEDERSGVEKPAAIIFETVQAEGGVNVSSVKWMKELRALCDEHDILLICDDVQVGCWRTGKFFSFERADIVPDMVVLSKSLSGYGFPMSVLLIKPEYDVWTPGEHNGTFRGNQLAFIAGSAALELQTQHDLELMIAEREAFLKKFLETHITGLHPSIRILGLGMIWGVDLFGIGNISLAGKVIASAFEDGLLIESSGRKGQVMKLLPALNIPISTLEKGCWILHTAVKKALQECQLKEVMYNVGKGGENPNQNTCVLPK
jgi:diaminobutyrate-2-oxoglutarate transaminase